MCICCVNEVQLAPGKRPFRIGGSVQGIWLHSSREPGVDVRVGRPIAGITGEGSSGCQRGEDGSPQHVGIRELLGAAIVKTGMRIIYSSGEVRGSYVPARAPTHRLPDRIRLDG